MAVNRYALNNSSSALFVRDSALGKIEAIRFPYAVGACIMALIYDHIITMDKEVARIWTLRWRLPKFLFIINRYIVPPMLLFSTIYQVLPNTSAEFCDFVKRWELWPAIIAQATTELILIIRVAALYENTKRIIAFLLVIYFVNVASGLVFIVMIIRNSFLSPNYDISPGCIFNGVGTFSLQWVGPIVFEGTLIILTLYKVFPTRREVLYGDLSPALGLVARDSVVYFIVIFVFFLINLLIYKYNDSALMSIVVLPTSVVECLAASHMMMNLRTLTVHDTIGRGASAVSSLNFNINAALQVPLMFDGPIDSQHTDIEEANEEPSDFAIVEQKRDEENA